MSQAIGVAAALLIGGGAGVQIAMLAAVGRDRGTFEASWISMLGTLFGGTVFLAISALRGNAPLLPTPFDRAPIYVLVGILAGVGLLLSARRLDPYFAIMGLFGLGVISGAAFLGPRIGIGLFLSAMIAGQMVMALALDHIGAFGVDVRQVDFVRLAGVGMLLLGVVLVQGRD